MNNSYILITALGKRPENYLLPLCSAQPISSQKPKRQTVSFSIPIRASKRHCHYDKEMSRNAV
jgi:hypothetical protein